MAIFEAYICRLCRIRECKKSPLRYVAHNEPCRDAFTMQLFNELGPTGNDQPHVQQSLELERSQYIEKQPHMITDGKISAGNWDGNNY